MSKPEVHCFGIPEIITFVKQSDFVRFDFYGHVYTSRKFFLTVSSKATVKRGSCRFIVDKENKRKKGLQGCDEMHMIALSFPPEFGTKWEEKCDKNNFPNMQQMVAKTKIVRRIGRISGLAGLADCCRL